MIEVRGIRKRFVRQKSKKEKEEFLAVNDISLKAKDAEIVGILGPNGAGKTTLLRIIAGIMEPTEGEVFYDDLNLESKAIEIKANLAYLSGNTKIYDTLSAFELMEMCLDYYDYPKEKRKGRIEEIAKSLDLEGFLYNKLANLSTGQTQRVNIARCLVHNPKYYILDEATSGLDIISSEVILDFIKKERDKGKTFLYSTHYMEEAENICDYVVMINKGKVLCTGTPEEIKKKTKTTNLRAAFFKLIGGEKHEN